MPILSAIVFTPLAGAFVLMLMRSDQPAALRRGAFLFSLVPFALSVLMLMAFDPAEPGFQFTAKTAWIPGFQVSYSVGVDGISLFLVLLTTFLTPLA
ncbi:MAG: NADH-quinone oxidoreductase subunit M, partial [Deltaproteobacteria bacterium]|nr:NADH-quinone oxidoreductase subunit M [Deltaproteobacteria bacterium]